MYIGLISLLLIVLSTYFYFLWHGLKFYVKLIIISMYSIQLISYSLTSLKNPGIIIESVNTKNFPQNDLIVCGKCLIISHIKDNAEHCSWCNVCIKNRDHHCPWTTKCIGGENLYSFYIFVGSTMGFMLSLYLGAFSYIFS